MSDATNALIIQLFDNVSQQIQENHTRLRADMTTGLREVRDEMRLQNGRVRAVEQKLTVIETERAAEEKQALKKATWVGMLAAALVQTLMKLIEGVHRS
jgi:hypothetical protein